MMHYIYCFGAVGSSVLAFNANEMEGSCYFLILSVKAAISSNLNVDHIRMF